MKLGEMIRHQRNRKKMTLSDLSLQTGISQPNLSQIETGAAKDTRFSTVCRIAKVLEMDLNILAKTDEAQRDYKPS